MNFQIFMARSLIFYLKFKMSCLVLYERKIIGESVVAKYLNTMYAGLHTNFFSYLPKRKIYLPKNNWKKMINIIISH